VVVSLELGESRVRMALEGGLQKGVSQNVGERFTVVMSWEEQSKLVFK